MAGTQVRRESLTHQTGDAVIELIRANNLRVGDRLPSINDIAEQIGVSTTVAREAIAELAGQGLIERKQGAGNVLALPGGANVARIFSMRSLVKGLRPEQLQEFRFPLEVAAARLAATAADDEGIALLESRLADLKSAESADELNSADVLFHLCIAQISGNDLFLMSLEAITPLLHELRERTWAGWSTRGQDRQDGIEQHVRIFDAIRLHDADGAARLMEDHLAQASESLAAAEPGDPQS